MVAGAARIRVTFQVDADGLLNVSAREESTGAQASVSVKPSYGLSDDEVARMLSEGMSHASDDAQARALREQQVELKQLLESVQSALETDGDLLETQERTQVDEVMQAGQTVLDDNNADADTVRQAVERLSQSTDSFAARRMDRSIRRALSGRSLDEVSKS